MMFAAPLFLLGLVPWGVITAWLLWGRRVKQPVPFLPLWEGGQGKQRVRRSVQTPPLALAAALAAMLVAVLGAARPTMRAGRDGRITVLIDRGVTMSATQGGRARFSVLAESLAERLTGDQSVGRVEVVDVLSGERHSSDVESWLKVVSSFRRTAVEISSLRAAVNPELLGQRGSVILLSDTTVDEKDPRFFQLFPSAPVHNLGITRLTARELPSVQVMVGVRSSEARGPVELRVRSGGREASQTINFTSAGKEQRAFIEMPALGDMIQARLVAADDLDADNMAWLVREGQVPRIEIRSQVSDALRRMVEVYKKVRPARDDSPAAVIVNRLADLAYGDAGVVAESPAGSTPVSGALRVITDPITALVNWAEVTQGANVAAAAPAGWTPLVTIGDRVVVARRQTPARQVWVGFDSPQWPRGVDFVVFWSNALNWVGGGGIDFVWHPVSMAPEHWKRQTAAPADAQANAWPGVFQRGDGSLLAMNAINVHFPASRDIKVPARFDGGRSSSELGPWMMLLAMALLLISALTWRRNTAVYRLPGTSFAGSAG